MEKEFSMGGLLRLISDPDDPTPANMTALDLLYLAPALRKIMILLLRQGEISYPRICELTDQFPEPERLNRPELDKALQSLVDQHWLIKLGGDALLTYKVDMRRKGANVAGVLPQKRQSNIKGIWDVLDLDEDQSDGKPAKSKGKSQSIWDMLDLDEMQNHVPSRQNLDVLGPSSPNAGPSSPEEKSAD
jgi:hypothetical protein